MQKLKSKLNIFRGGNILMKGVKRRMQKEDSLKLIAVKEFEEGEELYKIVDFLNKSLKDKNLIFGIRKNRDKRTITIYET